MLAQDLARREPTSRPASSLRIGSRLDGVLNVRLHQEPAQRFQRLRSCRNSSLRTANSHVLMLGTRHIWFFLMAGMTIVSPNKRRPVSHVESVAAHLDLALPFGYVNPCRQTQARRDQHADDRHLRHAVIAIGGTHRKVTRQRGCPSADLDDGFINRGCPPEQRLLKPSRRDENSGGRQRERSNAPLRADAKQQQELSATHRPARSPFQRGTRRPDRGRPPSTGQVRCRSCPADALRPSDAQRLQQPLRRPTARAGSGHHAHLRYGASSREPPAVECSASRYQGFGPALRRSDSRRQQSRLEPLEPLPQRLYRHLQPEPTPTSPQLPDQGPVQKFLS